MVAPSLTRTRILVSPCLVLCAWVSVPCRLRCSRRCVCLSLPTPPLPPLWCRSRRGGRLTACGQVGSVTVAAGMLLVGGMVDVATRSTPGGDRMNMVKPSQSTTTRPEETLSK